MKYTIPGSLLLVLLAGSGAVLADEHGNGMHHAAMKDAHAASASQAHKAVGGGK